VNVIRTHTLPVDSTIYIYNIYIYRPIHPPQPKTKPDTSTNVSVSHTPYTPPTHPEQVGVSAAVCRQELREVEVEGAHFFDGPCAAVHLFLWFVFECVCVLCVFVFIVFWRGGGV
jgi:hypothetical protein